MNVIQDEVQLVNAACQGSIEAFEALVVRYEPRIRRMIYGLTQDVYLTQDLCQETFLAAYRALPHVREENLHFAPWLYRIALNQVRSEWRRRKHVTLVPFSASSAEDDETWSEAREDLLVSEERFEEQIAYRDLVGRVLAQLPTTSAACLLLDAEGFTYNEIAEMLQETLPAIRSRLARARQAFQRIYLGLEQEE
jgi:RNA polymerase sigma-70 factor (ECF subfamily)